MSEEDNCYLLKPFIRKDKNIVFKGKKYLIDFQLLQQFSNYFYSHREEYAYKSDIEIPSELLEDDDSSIEMFTKSIQNEKFTIDEQNVFSLNLLSSIYEISSLKEHTSKYMINHNVDLVLSTLLYKNRQKYKNSQENNKIENMNTHEEEETIATNIEKYINKDELVKLPVSILYRILNHPKLNAISGDQINRFLFKCLDEHKKEASVLFLNERLNILSEEVFLHLLKEYEDVFDFQLIGCRQIVKLLSEMKQSNDELTKCMKETKDNLEMQNRQITVEKDEINRQISEEKDKLQNERDYLKSFVDRIRGIIPYKNDDEIFKIIEDNFHLSNDIHDIFQGCNTNEITGFIRKDTSLSYNIRKFFNSGDDPFMINQIKTDHEKIKEMTNLENKLKQYESLIKQQEIKEKENNKIINQMKEDNLRLLKENNKLKEDNSRLLEESQEMTVEHFNKLPFQKQISVFKLPNNEMLNKIKNLLNYLSRDKNITGACIEILCQQNEKITSIKECEVKLLPYAIEHLFNSKMINTAELITIFNEFIALYIGINYKNTFHDIYKELSLIINKVKTKIELFIVIPSSVTSIGNYAFNGCSSLTHIIIPSSVTSIGNSAFEGCSSLTHIIIPSSVTSIGNSAFNGCSSLTQITIPSSVTSIGDFAFNGCSSLTQIIIPSSVTSIGNSAFNGCSSLTQIIIPSSVTSIGDFAFNGCSSLTQITIPSSVTSIGNSAFYGCSSLTHIIIPSSVTSIGKRAFRNCSSLLVMSIPSSINREYLEINHKTRILDIDSLLLNSLNNV